MKFRILLSIVLVVFGFMVHAQMPEVGQKAPEIIQTTPTGDTLRLSDLKGQMVLIDFWASWCVPCRRENPNVIEAYNKFKDATFKDGSQGFTVLSVSLDMKKDKWVEAIAQDAMVWPYHVCDLKGWFNSAAKLYNIKSVPTNFLIDGEGTILAINLRGTNLAKELKKNKKGLF